jgi:hypothetical protein
MSQTKHLSDHRHSGMASSNRIILSQNFLIISVLRWVSKGLEHGRRPPTLKWL